MDLSEIKTLLQAAGLTTHTGYAPTGAKPPYCVARPMISLPETEAITGAVIGWDSNFAVYCVAGSVGASYNLGRRAVAALQGTRAGGTTLSCSVGYTGAQVEGRYETQITVQLDQGVL